MEKIVTDPRFSVEPQQLEQNDGNNENIEK